MMRSRTKMLTCWFIVVVMTGGVGGVYLYFPGEVTQPQAVSRCGQFGMTLLEIYTIACVLFPLEGGVGGVYLYLPEEVTQPQAVSRCGQFGMTLLEIYSQTQLDIWNNITTALFSLQTEITKGEPWLGLDHDGSSQATYSNYRWLDAGNVSFLEWYKGEPNGFPNDGCVRIRKGQFGTMHCDQLYSTVCQPAVHLGLTATQDVFRLVFNKTSATETVLRFKASTFAPSYATAHWLVPVNAPSDVIDLYDCVMHCFKSPGCAFVTHNRTAVASACVAFLQADLPAIH